MVVALRRLCEHDRQWWSPGYANGVLGAQRGLQGAREASGEECPTVVLLWNLVKPDTELILLNVRFDLALVHSGQTV